MTSYDRGKRFELRISRLIRKKLGARVQRDKRSGAGDFQKADVSDYYRELPLHLELKDQQTVKVKEWYRQAAAGASYGQAPTVVFAADEEDLAVIRFSDLLDLVAEVKQLQAQAERLSRSVTVPPGETWVNGVHVSNCPITRITEDTPELHVNGSKVPVSDLAHELPKRIQSERGSYQTCRNGHLIQPGASKCLAKGCPFSTTYKKPKEKKR